MVLKQNKEDLSTSKISTVIRWAGSKRLLLQRLSLYWPTSAARYVEPFAGSAALFFYLQPSKSLLGDTNFELINALRVLRKSPDILHATLVATPLNSTKYYEIRRIDPSSLSSFDRAARFFYLNRNCFNGIYRTNSQGQFNVPFGATKKRSGIPSIENFRRCAIQLKNATILHTDYSNLLKRAEKGDFFYLDPPYAVSNRRVFREYSSAEFSLDDFRNLSAQLRSLHNLGVHFVLSYADCIEARQLSKHWNVRRVRVRRHIAGFSSSRRNAFELLISNIDA